MSQNKYQKEKKEFYEKFYKPKSIEGWEVEGNIFDIWQFILGLLEKQQEAFKGHTKRVWYQQGFKEGSEKREKDMALELKDFFAIWKGQSQTKVALFVDAFIKSLSHPKEQCEPLEHDFKHLKRYGRADWRCPLCGANVMLLLIYASEAGIDLTK